MMRLVLRDLGIITLTTLYIQLSHAHQCHLNFGTCSSPSIQYGFNIDGSQRYGYAATYGHDFPHGWSPDIATIESSICNRLESPCNAPPETVQICHAAFNLYSGLTGEIAVHAWNEALGVGDDDGEDDDDDDHGNYGCTLPPNDDYLTTMTLIVYAPQTIYPISTAIESTITTTTQTQTTEPITTKPQIYTLSPTTSTLPSSSTLTITITLPSSTTHQAGHATSTSTSTSTSTTLTAQTSDTTTSVAAAQTSNTSNPPNNDGNDDGGGPGGGSPFDPESSASSLSSSFSRSDSTWPPLAYLTSVPGLLTLVMGFMV